MTTSVAIMQALRLYCNYASGTYFLLASYDGGSFSVAQSCMWMFLLQLFSLKLCKLFKWSYAGGTTFWNTVSVIASYYYGMVGDTFK